MKVTTMLGKVIDVGSVIEENSNIIAIGNANMNAGGDIIGDGGQVLVKKEQVAHEYYKRNPNAVKQVSLKDVQVDTFLSPAEAVAEVKKTIAENKAAMAAQITKAGTKTIIDSDD